MPEKKSSRSLSVEEEVNAWFNDTFHNHGPALSEPLFHYFLEAKGKLIARLTTISEKEG
jgi:hypothetical protein